MQGMLFIFGMLVIMIFGIIMGYILLLAFAKIQSVEGREKERKWAKTAFRICAGIFAASGVALTIYSSILAVKGVKTMGTVVELRERKPSDDDQNRSPLLAPVFVFTNAVGEKFEVVAGAASRQATMRIGEERAILYLQSRPKWAQIDSIEEMWSGPIGCGMGALMFWIIADWRIVWGRVWKRFVRV